MQTLLEAIVHMQEAVNVEKTVASMGAKLQMRFKQDGKNRDPGEFIQWVMDEIDPTPQNKYTLWILRTYIKGGIQRAEDITKLRNEIDVGKEDEDHTILSAFDKYKKQLGTEYPKDIGQYKRLSDFIDAVMSLQGTKSGKEASAEEDTEMAKQSKVWMDNDQYKVVSPLTKEASCHFGKNTQWCTAGRDHNLFDEYHDDNNPLYIILHKESNTRWQFQWSTEQFMDERDEQINLYEFFKTHPKILEVPEFNEFFAFTDEGYVIRIPE